MLLVFVIDWTALILRFFTILFLAVPDIYSARHTFHCLCALLMLHTPFLQTQSLFYTSHVPPTVSRSPHRILHWNNRVRLLDLSYSYIPLLLFSTPAIHTLNSVVLFQVLHFPPIKQRVKVLVDKKITFCSYITLRMLSSTTCRCCAFSCL